MADVVAEKTMEKYGWVISIHDAFLCSPQAAADVRKWYAAELVAIYRDRKVILKDYFKSIGITTSAQSQLDTLMSKVVPADENITVNPMALK